MTLILKKYKNEFLQEIIKEGLNPKIFQTKEKLDIIGTLADFRFSYPTRAFIIKLRNTKLLFSFKYDSFYNEFHFRQISFMPKFYESQWHGERKFEKIKEHFLSWLRTSVKEFIKDKEQPDLWAELKNHRLFLDDVEITDENTSDFSEQEKTDLRNSLENFKKIIGENFKPNPKQTEYINKQLDYLSEAVERLNRFDWRGLAISTLMSIAINLSVDTEKGRLLFSLFQQAIHSATKLLQ